ncbi:pilus assembly protein TadG-related protein [Streptomyces sp. NPDC051183]|uniref:pilus assembly protein TadG-related protein n=1 Tax=Streptomyces sp. NPDC051183 TaxID=3155165 RepID=UPI00343E4026
MTSGRFRDRGQAFPIFMVAVVGLLFAALAYFAFGQASVIRSNAQKAADAGALAAARDARNTLLGGFNPAAFKREDWSKLLDGKLFDAKAGCAAAKNFARDNGSTAACDASEFPRFTVTATTAHAIGDSVVPGAAGTPGVATATAVIKPRCTLSPPPDAGDDPPAEGTPLPVDFKCSGADPIRLDPSKPPTWPELAHKLFSVNLVK